MAPCKKAIASFIILILIYWPKKENYWDVSNRWQLYREMSQKNVWWELQRARRGGRPLLAAPVPTLTRSTLLWPWVTCFSKVLLKSYFFLSCLKVYRLYAYILRIVYFSNVFLLHLCEHHRKQIMTLGDASSLTVCIAGTVHFDKWKSLAPTLVLNQTIEVDIGT